jgi:hypothetical protein
VSRQTRQIEQRLDESVHAFGAALDAVEKVLTDIVEGVPVVLRQNAGEPLNAVQRRPQVVRDGPRECLELVERMFERGGVLRKCLIALPKAVVEARVGNRQGGVIGDRTQQIEVRVIEVRRGPLAPHGQDAEGAVAGRQRHGDDGRHRKPLEGVPNAGRQHRPQGLGIDGRDEQGTPGGGDLSGQAFADAGPRSPRELPRGRARGGVRMVDTRRFEGLAVRGDEFEQCSAVQALAHLGRQSLEHRLEVAAELGEHARNLVDVARVLGGDGHRLTPRVGMGKRGRWKPLPGAAPHVVPRAG